MIKIERTNKPLILTKNEAEWLKAINEAHSKIEIKKAKNKKITKTEQNALEKAIDKYKHKKIKEALEEMFYNKCAYCESSIKPVSYGDIEHFYPTSSYPTKSVIWDNLLLACDVCNRTFKNKSFPLDADNNPLLINPVDENPNDFLDFIEEKVGEEYIFKLKEKDIKGKESITIIGLNRIDLEIQRTNYTRDTLFFALRYKKEGDLEAKKCLERRLKPNSPYLAFTRMVIKNYDIVI